jgi:hypothetical protein
VKEWLTNVFGIFKSPAVIAHWLALSALGCVPALIALKVDSFVLTMMLFPLGLFLGAATVMCGYAILRSVAKEEASVSDWPTVNPTPYMRQLVAVVVAAAIATLPIAAACTLIMGPHMIGVVMTMFSIYVLFPFVVLSMLDMNSPFVPFSAEVARSVTKSEESWGGFYFSSGLLFVALFLIFMTSSSSEGAGGVVISIVACIGAVFAYFSMIGRLAYAIGQSVDGAPMEDEAPDS